MNHGNQNVEFNPGETRPSRRGPSWIMIFAMALLAFWFIQRNRDAEDQGNVENPPAAGAQLPDQRPQEPHGTALDRAFGNDGDTPTGDPSEVTLEPATGRSESSEAKTTRGDWSLEEVEVEPSATSDPTLDPPPKKTRQGDWELEVD